MYWNFGLLTKTTWYKIYLCVSLLIQMAMELVEREREKKDEYICSVSSFQDVLYNITTFLELYLLQPRANFSATSRRTWGRGRVRCNQANIFFFVFLFFKPTCKDQSDRLNIFTVFSELTWWRSLFVKPTQRRKAAFPVFYHPNTETAHPSPPPCQQLN